MRSKNLLIGALFLTITITFSCKRNVKNPLDDSNLLLGNPSKATHDTSNNENYLIDHKYYIESYSRSKGEPNWVSWHISSKDLGFVQRADDFRPDSIDLPKGWFEVDEASYKGSGFDRGHNCPSGDRTCSNEANASTFFMDNMIPQAPKNNRKTWEHFEVYCREQVKQGNEAYVIMGSYGEGGNGKLGFRTTIADGRINVPSNIWKIVLIIPDGDDDLNRIDEHATVIAINTPNNNSISPYWKNYVCTVKDIESVTGYTFFSNLPLDIRNKLENEVFTFNN